MYHNERNIPYYFFFFFLKRRIRVGFKGLYICLKKNLDKRVILLIKRFLRDLEENESILEKEKLFFLFSLFDHM